ncbi:cyclin-like protein interacting with PHO85 [Coemansia sp. RSA 1365]|nr:cyclin-like protein interacting with PHO85 [Coemansia sp. RSA 1365]
MVFELATTPVHETANLVAAYLDTATGCSRALELQIQDPHSNERQTSLSLFHARSVPTIDLETYISRIHKYCPCQNEVFLALIVYLQQLIDRYARQRIPFTIDAYSIHRLVITGVTVGSKWFSDVFFTNSRYAKVGGLSARELNNLELQFLSIMDFDLNVQPEVLQAIGTDLFLGNLPMLKNAHLAPMDNIAECLQMSSLRHHQYQPPVSATNTHFACNFNNGGQPQRGYYPQLAGNDRIYNPQQHRQCRQPLNDMGHDSQQRILRHMSYPGPSGICYNPYNYISNTDNSTHNHNVRKTGNLANIQGAKANAPNMSSGSTLASSPPRVSVHISALDSDAV